MRVFVIGTGRCGSKAFARACSHVENYTSNHESKVTTDWPDNHIEVNPRLAWTIPLLKSHLLRHRQSSVWWLRRSKEDVVTSWLRRGMNKGAGHYWRLVGQGIDFEEAASLCYDHMAASIQSLGTRLWLIDIENIKIDYQYFWHHIGAEGNLQEALKEFDWREKA